MAEFAILLQAIAALLWPLFAFTALYVFRSQIADIASRLKRGKILGQEIELNESLKRLDESAVLIEQTVAELPLQLVDKPNQLELQQKERVIDEIVSEASRSPKVALIQLARELEKLALQLVAATGLLNGRNFIPLSQALYELQQYGLPEDLPHSFKLFWNMRNRLIHDSEGNDEDILRAVDSGLKILKALQALPREINVVHHAGVPLYNDSLLTSVRSDVVGVILETTSPDGNTKLFRIFPTTKNHFKKGHQVSWEWNMGLIWGELWYKDPDTNEVKMAFSSSAEFIGRHLDEL